MRQVFITHTPHLLEEFLFNETLWKHKDRTPTRTSILIEALQSLGRAVRLNLTLWLLATEHSVDEVHKRIQERLKPHVSLDSVGDIFVIEVADFVGTTSQDTIAQVQSICEVRSTPNPSTTASPASSTSTSKPKRVDPIVEPSRREQLAEEYGIKPTDAMFWRLPGSYEGGRR